MRPESAALRVLAAVIDEDLQAIRRLDSALGKFSTGLVDAAWDDAGVWASAGALHGIYNALENTFVRISDTFGDKVDRSARWHAELLQRMLLDIPGLRAAVLPPETRPTVRELLGFRHLYRHGYDLELNGEKLHQLVTRWRAGREEIMAAVEAFRQQVLRDAAQHDA